MRRKPKPQNEKKVLPTLDTYMDIILRLLRLSGVFVGFGEGV